MTVTKPGFKNKTFGCSKLLSRMERSLRRVAMVAKFLELNKPSSCMYGKKKTKKVVMYDFPEQDCTQEQNGSLFYSSIVRQCKWPSLSRRIVEIKKIPTVVTRRQTSSL